MTMKTKTSWFYLLCSIALFSCSDDDGNTAQPTVAELLTSGRWYFQTVSSSELNACEKTTFIEFFDNGNAYSETYSLNTEGACTMISSSSGTYELLSDTQLSITNNGETNDDLVIVQISETQLILRDESGSMPVTISLDKTRG